MKAALSVLCLLLPLAVAGQTSELETREIPVMRRGYFVELLGNGLLYSVNYERVYRDHLSVRAGVMVGGASVTVNETGNSASVGMILAPIMASTLVGSGKHRLEFGAGLLGIAFFGSVEPVGNISTLALGATARIGYLYLPDSPGTTFRFAYTPLLTGTFSHSIGLAVGWMF